MCYKRLRILLSKRSIMTSLNQRIVEIDGSQLEGGGQILRISSALSAIFKVPIHLTKIRAGRTKGGLRPQHLTGLQLVRDICQGRLDGGKIDSLEVQFRPGDIIGGSFMADTQTAGSVCLLIQSLLPCSLFGKKETSIIMRGGTNADMAPPIDYAMEVFKKICGKFGINYEINLKIRGFYPKGQGEVHLKVTPLKGPIKPIEMVERGDVISIYGYSFVAGVLPIKMAHGMADSAMKTLRNQFGSDVKINIKRFKEDASKAVGNGAVIILWAETSSGCVFGSSGLGRRDRPPEQVGQIAAQDLLEDLLSGSCVDRHAQDQVVILMALADGLSRIRTSKLTLHTETAIHIVQSLTKAKFTMKEDASSNTVIMECRGVGFSPPST